MRIDWPIFSFSFHFVAACSCCVVLRTIQKKYCERKCFVYYCHHHNTGATQMSDIYDSGFKFFYGLGFIIAWIAFTLNVGFFGFVFGWFPAIFIGLIVGFAWPLLLAGAAAIAISIA
jgi:hypothetical protein